MELIVNIYYVTVLLAAIVGFSTRTIHSSSVQLQSILLVIILLVELPVKIFNLRGPYQDLIYMIYGPIEYGFMCYLYASHFKSAKVIKLVKWSALLYTLLSVVSGLYYFEYYHLSYNFLVRSILIICLLINYVYELCLDDKIIIISKEPLFWISIGNFFFFAGTFFVMGLVAQLEDLDPKLSEQVFILNPILNIFLYLTFIIGFLCKIPMRRLK